MPSNGQPVWLAIGLRTPFVGVDGPFANRDSLALSVPVVRAMAPQVKGPIDFAVWGSVVLNLAYANLAREVWLESKLDPACADVHDHHAMQHEHGRRFRSGRDARAETCTLAIGWRCRKHEPGPDRLGAESVGLATPHVSSAQHRTASRSVADMRPSDIRLHVPEVKNRVTGRSMGEHTEDMAKDLDIGRQEQDELALQGHQRAVAAQDRGFFTDLIVPVDGTNKDHFPRRDTSMEKLAKLKPVFDRTSGRGTLTAGNSSPLTDGAAAIWVATDEGLDRLPGQLPRARLVDFEMAAVDIFTEGCLWLPCPPFRGCWRDTG